MLAAGEVVGRYQLICPIGNGGMARVWAAREQGSQRLVALKIIHSRYAENPAFRSMFLDEARIISAIGHRNVARIHDFAESESLLYISMEYVDGESLFAMIAPDKTVAPSIALRIIADACAGLAAVHQAADAAGIPLNVVHRDISPQNLLLTARGEVKLIDFGIAHVRDRASPTTDIRVVKGNVRYMAPEQARREALGPFSDVFSVGAVLFRMLAGRAPYAAANEVSTIRALLENAPRIAALPPDIPEPVVAILDRALSTSIDRRYPTARQMQDAIEGYLAKTSSAPDVGAWVEANLSPEARSRRLTLSKEPAYAPTEEMSAVVRPRQRHDPRGAPARAPAADDEADGPGFMDVAALKARAPSAPAVEVPPDSERGLPDAPAPVRPRQPPKVDAGPSRAKALRAAILVTAAVVLVVVGLFALPSIARSRAIAAAREIGVDLTIDRVGVGFSGISLRGVTAKPTRIGGIETSADEVFLIGLSGHDVRIQGLTLRIDGSPDDLAVGVAFLIADLRARHSGTAASPRHLSINGARLDWERLFGEGSHLEASDLSLDLDSRAPGIEDVRGNIGKIALTTRETRLGPWASSFESAPTSGRFRLMLDPPVPDGPSALVVWGQSAAPELTVRIPRSPFLHLGLDPQGLGLPADSGTELELKIDGKLPSTERAELKAVVDLWQLRPRGFARAVDVHAEGMATGARGKPLSLEKSSVSLGPFVANVTGNLTPYDRGLRVDAIFKTVPTACEKLARAEAKGLGPLAVVLQALGQSTGALRVIGTVNASGVLKYDTADPDGASVTWLSKETCGVSIFGL